MPRTCTICAHQDRKIIDSMIANRDPYMAIARKFTLNTQTVNNHGKAHVMPFVEEVERQAQAAVLDRVMKYRDVVNLPLPEKSKHAEDRLWDQFYAVHKPLDRVVIIKAIREQQAEQAKLTGAYTQDQANQTDIVRIADQVAKQLIENGWSEADAKSFVSKKYPDVSNAIN